MSLSTMPVAWYKFEGNGNDATANAHSLTAVNSPTYTTGKIGSAANLVAASSQYFSVASHADFVMSGDFTITAWVNYTNNGAIQTIVHKGTGGGATAVEYMINITTGDQPRFRLSNGTSVFDATGASIGSGPGWVFLAARYKASTKVLSIRANAGTPATNTLTGTLRTGTATMYIGASSGTNSFANGPIDMVGFFQANLSDADLNTIYAAGAGLDYPFGGVRRVGMNGGTKDLTGGMN